MKKTETEFIECLSKDLDDLIIKYIHSPDVYYQELPSVCKLDEGNRLYLRISSFKKREAWNRLLSDLKYIDPIHEYVEELTKEPHPLYPSLNNDYRNVKFREMNSRDVHGVTRKAFVFSYIKNGTEYITEFNNNLIDSKDLED